ncbi:hypothetical protein BGY98DRAFT_1098220 [Russula aff. rugulosa BPL654]|nr:hypothetical protein BGY98DRAFT_1098220 [Russula aff. rugulosa BPL654]
MSSRQHERERAWNVEQATIGALQNIVSRASLVTHPHPVMARTSQGQLQIVRLIRAMIHKRHHPMSQFVAELPRKGEESHAREHNWGHRTQDGITNIAHRPRPFLDHRCLRHTPSQLSLHSEGSSRPSPPADLTYRRKNEDEEAIYEREHNNSGLRQQKWTNAYIHKQAASPNPSSILASGQTQSLIPAPLLSEQHLSSRHSAPPPEVPKQAEHDETLHFPMLTPPQPKPTNGCPHTTTRFGWQFPRNRQQLPDFERDTSSPEHSPLCIDRLVDTVGSGIPNHIPVRSPGQVPKVVIKRSGDSQTFMKGLKCATTEFSEANGAVPPKSCSIFPGSDDSIQDVPTRQDGRTQMNTKTCPDKYDAVTKGPEEARIRAITCN